jgi:hypothetical protein
MDLLQNYEFSKLKTFMEDLSYLMQMGGGPSKGGSSGPAMKVIGHMFYNVFMILALLVALYVVYYCIFKGYPRFAVNLFTLSFFRKEKFEKILTENDTLFSNFDMIAFLSNTETRPLATLDNIYSQQQQLFTRLGERFEQAKQLIDDEYTTLKYKNFNTVFRYRDKYKVAFVEYFLFYKTLLANPPDTKNLSYELPSGEIKAFTVTNYQFYENLIVYLQKMGAIPTKNDEKRGEMSINRLMFDMHEEEKTARKSFLRSRLTFNKTIRDISNDLKIAVDEILTKTPYHYYILCPNTDANISNLFMEFDRAKTKMQEYKVYTQKAETYSIYFWMMLEIYEFHNIVAPVGDSTGANLYKLQIAYIQALDRILPEYSGYRKRLVAAFLNIPQDKRKKIETRLMRQIPYVELEVIKKYPLIAALKYSEIPPNRRHIIYYKIMELYAIFMSGDRPMTPDAIQEHIPNLIRNSRDYKQAITSLHAVHLYLNVYRNDFTRMITLRNLSPNLFLKELITPHMDDIFNNRIKSYFRSIVSARYWKRDLIPRFKQRWADLGDVLDYMMRKVWGSFKQKDESSGTKYDQPDPRTPQPPPQPEAQKTPDTSAANA